VTSCVYIEPTAYYLPIDSTEHQLTERCSRLYSQYPGPMANRRKAAELYARNEIMINPLGAPQL